MKDLWKNLLLSFSTTEEPTKSEEERLITEIEEAKEKTDYAWRRLNDAAPEYVEIAVLEILLSETQYSLLNRRYRLMQGIKEESPIFIPSSAKDLSFSLEAQLQNHAFYGAFFSPTAENPSAETPQLMSPS